MFAPLHRELIGLLRSLDNRQWHLPTVAGSWLVRDVAAHLLQGDLNRLSRQRDHYLPPDPPPPPKSYEDVLQLINNANRAAVAAMRAFSPRILTDMLERSGQELALLVARTPANDPALFPVAWAGETQSLMWMDIGREFTERWHHQQQIRMAVGAPLLLDAQWSQPIFELSMRAVPRAYADVSRADGTAVVIGIEDVGEWSLVRFDDEWRLRPGVAPRPLCRIRVDADAAWRIFYNAAANDHAIRLLQFEGDEDLARAFTHTRSVMV